MPSFLESVSNSVRGKGKKKDDGEGLNFQQRLQSMLGGPEPKKKKKSKDD